MPVLKTYINGKWENVSGFESNADTVDGKHASEFASVVDVEELKNKVGDTSVSQQISEAVANIEVSDEIYVQNNEPIDAEDGALWVDLDEESGASGNSSSVELDTTLTKKGYAADAKAVGNAINKLSGGNQSGEVVEDIEIIATEGKFAKWTTGEVSGGNESSVAWASHSQFIKVGPGETLRISCKAATTVCPGVVFYSTDTMSAANSVGYALENPGTGDPVSGSVNRYTYTKEDVIVPDGAAYAILNNADNYDGWKCQKITVTLGYNGTTIKELEEKLTNAEYENEQLVRRLANAEKYNDFTWGTFDKAYFVFVHDDSREFITTAYNAFHSKGVPLSSAAIAPYLHNTHGDKTVKEWLDLIVADGGEVLCHYSYDLLDSDDDSVWYKQVVDAKREFEKNGFNIRGLILAGSSDVNSAKGEKFCRKYFDYADKVGTSTRYNLGRKGMWTFASLDDFKARIDSCAGIPGIYAFGFHGNRDDETWITEDSLKEIIDYVSAKDNCEITTYSDVFDSIGTTVLEKRIAALEV